MWFYILVNIYSFEKNFYEKTFYITMKIHRDYFHLHELFGVLYTKTQESNIYETWYEIFSNYTTF